MGVILSCSIVQRYEYAIKYDTWKQDKYNRVQKAQSVIERFKDL